MESVRQLSEDSIIVREGEICEKMFKLLQGKAAVYFHYGEESEFLVGILSDGKCFNEVGFLTRGKSPYTIVAFTDVLLLQISQDNFQQFIVNNPRNVIDIMKSMSQSIVAMKKHVDLLNEEVMKSVADENANVERNKFLQEQIMQYKNFHF